MYGLEPNIIIYQKKYTWTDNTNMNYTNWSKDAPVSDSNHDCVILNADIKQAGQWINKQCAVSNNVVCEKEQSRSIEQLFSLFSDANRKIELINAQLNELNRTSVVQVGFVYTQLPGQTDPQAIWPSFRWSEISSDYSGLFFRVLGGNSSHFGTVQKDNSREITKINFKFYNTNDNGYYSVRDSVILDKPVNDIIQSAKSNFQGNLPDRNGLLIEKEQGEIRPVNQAVKIWKRIR